MSEDNWNDVLNKIRGELANLAKFVDNTRKGIDNLELTVKVGSEKFPEASNQLNAVTGDLEKAADNIMTILEGLMAEQDRTNALLNSLSVWAATLDSANADKGQGFIKELGVINEKAKKEMMDIFTNMSFHDLSGQKLKKVIGSLAVVESKLLELALTFGFKGDALGDAKEEPHFDTSLQGPSNPMPIDQSVVDKIMKELGA